MVQQILKQYTILFKQINTIPNEIIYIINKKTLQIFNLKNGYLLKTKSTIVKHLFYLTILTNKDFIKNLNALIYIFFNISQ